MTYVAAEFGKTAFHCLHSQCGTFADQEWDTVYYKRPHPQNRHSMYHEAIPGLLVTTCRHCKGLAVWQSEKLVYPRTLTAPLPHADMPDKIRLDYEEARAVLQDSPRSSAALLRLAIQKLCVELGQDGKNLNADIRELVRGGLPARIQQSLDIVRVVGNNQVHPGVLDVRDDPTMALHLFGLVNIIVENQISNPKHIDALYLNLPELSRKQIEERDSKPPSME